MKLATAALFLAMGSQAMAQGGLLAKSNAGEMPSLTLSAGQPLSDQSEIKLESGKVYELEIEADGSAELAIAGSGFFRAIWINEVVINDIEIRPFGVESLEFDDEGSAEIEFVAIRPGRYPLGVPGRESQTVTIIIE